MTDEARNIAIKIILDDRQADLQEGSLNEKT